MLLAAINTSDMTSRSAYRARNSILALPSAVLTHCYAILFVLFTALAFVVLLQEGKKKANLTVQVG